MRNTRGLTRWMRQVIHEAYVPKYAYASVRTYVQTQKKTHESKLPNTQDKVSSVELTSKDGKQYLFVRGQPRPWGPSMGYNVEGVLPWNGVGLDTKVVVVREPFRLSTKEETPINQILRKLRDGLASYNGAFLGGVNTQLADVYDAHGNVTETRNVELSTLLHSAGIDLHLEGSQVKMDAQSKQSTNEVLMVAPSAFEYNEQTAQDNYFMHSISKSQEVESRVNVLKEYAGLYDVLVHEVGLKVNLFQHSKEHRTPDACFPNNWFTTHASGETSSRTLVTYPLKCTNRRRERRRDILDYVQSIGKYDKVIHLEDAESQGKYLEGTGCIICDRVGKKAYVALSERSDLRLAERWAEEVGYEELIPFHSYDASDHPVYHTNVLMAIGSDVAVVCTDSIKKREEKDMVLKTLGRTHEIVDISFDQMSQFCGNVLEVRDRRGLPVFVMSTQAYNGFTDVQKQVLNQHLAGLYHAPIDTIEKIGGGGVRCAIAELF